MSYLSKLSSRIEAVLRIGHFRANASFHGANSCWWNRRINCGPSIASVNNPDTALGKFGARFYSKKGIESPKPTLQKKKSKPKKEMEKEKEKEKNKEEEAFYVVRRGDAVGFYRNLDDCQAQVGSSICDSPVSVFKGYGLQKNTEEYLAARGLKNALYTISAVDLKEDLFGKLVQCPLPDLVSSEDASKKRSQLEAGLESVEGLTSVSTSANLSQKLAKLTPPDILSSPGYKSCLLRFDGASKGNPGRSGAGAVLLAGDGSLICTLREGCGTVTCNVAEYRALRLGLKVALEKGFKGISVQGDSKLVCMQVMGLWKAKHKNLTGLHEEVTDLKNQFHSFQIVHVLRDLNSEADAAANRAVTLSDGEIVEETS